MANLRHAPVPTEKRTQCFSKHLADREASQAALPGEVNGEVVEFRELLLGHRQSRVSRKLRFHASTGVQIDS
jgi:hypothetical protein